MIMDAQLLYSDAQALAATGVSTNVIDHSQDRDLGIGEPMAVVVSSDAALTGTNGQVQLQSDSVVGFGSAVVVAQSAVYTPATLPLGTRIALALPPDKSMNRFSRLNYVLTAATWTVTAGLIPAKALTAENVFQGAFTVA